jgi:hypothetical protein
MPNLDYQFFIHPVYYIYGLRLVLGIAIATTHVKYTNLATKIV